MSKAPVLPKYTRRQSLINLEIKGDVEYQAPERFIHESSYRQTVIFLLALAVNRIFPDRELIIQSNYTFMLKSRSYHARFAGHACTEKDLAAIRAEMEKLIKMEVPIDARFMEYKECYQHFIDTKQSLSAKLVKSLNESRYKVAGCTIDNKKFYTLQFRPFLANTKYVQDFGLFADDASDLKDLGDFDDFEIGDAGGSDEKEKEKGKENNVLSNFIIAFPEKGSQKKIEKPDVSTSVRRLYAQGVKIGKMLGLECVGDLNELIQKGHSKELILLSEAYHDMQIVNIARQIRQKKRDTKGKLKVILIRYDFVETCNT